MRAAAAQTSVCICAVWPEPFRLVYEIKVHFGRHQDQTCLQNMGLGARKPGFVACEQQRRRQVCASDQRH